MNFTNTKDALYIACIEGSIKNVSRLLQLMPVDEVLTSSGSTALIIACRFGYKNLVHFLLDNKADTTICTNNGDTALSISIDKGNIACVTILSKYIYTDPQALLKFQSNLWNFDNNIVNAYRKYSNKKRYPISVTKQIWQRLFPEYFSETPLPSNCSKGLLKIQLPRHLSQNKKYSVSSINTNISKASDVIKSSIGKLDEPKHHYRNGKDFMIKISGEESYMYGRKYVIDYEAIRIAFYNEDDVELRLVKIENCSDKIRKELDELIDKLLCGYLRGFVTLTMTNLFKQFVGSNIGATTKQINDGHVDEKEAKMDILMQQNVISLYNLDSKYKLKIIGLSNVKLLPRFDAITMKSIYVMAELWIGDQIFDQSIIKTDNVIPNNNIKWSKWLYCENYSFLYSQIPREAVLCFMVMSDNDECLAWCRLTLVDYKMMLRQGKYLLNMWEISVFQSTKNGVKHDPFKDRTFRYKGTVTDKKLKNIDIEKQCQLAIEFDTFGFDVIAPKYLPDIQYKEDDLGIKLKPQQVSKLQKQKLDKLLYHTPLSKTIDTQAQTLIWQARDLLYHDRKSLCGFLKSVNWTKISHILEAHKYLALWCRPHYPQNALEYLNFKFSDTKVREKAVEWIDEMHNSELCNIMLPLVQCLKYELYHNSCLERFLLNRAIQSPNQIGHLFFWYLFEEFNSENLEYRERFGLLLEEYLSVSVEHSKQLFLQMAFVKRLQIISNKMKSSQSVHYNDDEKDDMSMKRLFYNELNQLNEEIVSRMQLPLNPRMYAKNVVVEKCEYKICKTENYLLLMLQNTDEYAHDIAIKFIFGSENNLKENMLIIQLFNILDRIWMNEQCDALLKSYSIWTMGNVGMIEIIQNSQTITDINAEFGGGFDERTIEKYLTKFNTDNTYDQSLKKARDAFAKSCAAYCIGTMILGITERNEDNCMVRKNGHCFHVNFEYNHKKMDFQRERAACFMNPQMKYAIDGGVKKAPLWNIFMNCCTELYSIIRLRAKSLFVILTLMISYGSPQLLNESDIQYVENMLHLHYDNKKAEKYVQKQIKAALKDKKRYFDDYAFLMPHRHS